MDETALQYNMPSKKTIHKIGAKTIVIRTQKQEKCRISLILTIAGNGKKLIPFVIFKGAKNGKIYKTLIQNDFVKQNRYIVACNQNAWSTNELIQKWIDMVYIPFFRKIDLEKTLLVFDRAPMHDNYQTINYLNKKKINFVFIPKGMTSVLQPLDVSINRPFKDSIRHKYDESISAFKKVKVEKNRREQLLQWIVESWENKDEIKEEIIIKSFLTCGITNNTDCSEDYLFTGQDKLKEDGLVEDYKLIIKDTTKDDEEDENNSIDVKSSSDSEMASSIFDFEENSSEK